NKESSYPVDVRHNERCVSYTKDGKQYEEEDGRVLFFDEIPIPKSALVRPRFRARRGGVYYYVNLCGDVCQSDELRAKLDEQQYEAGNYFETEELAMDSDIYKAFERMKEDR
ncbi:MAG: hypothetical protein ACRCZ2_08350, partial [Fusobacteriaceae bacterium]